MPTDIPDRVRTPPADEARERLFVRPDATREVEIAESDDGPTEITVPISSTTEHRSGGVMTESALESMAEQLAEGTVGLWDDHGLDEFGWPEYRRSDMYGWWVDGTVENETLLGTARLREGDERSADLVDQLDQGMPVGFSVGYIPTDEEMLADADQEGDETRHILDVDLLETSPVGIPDNPDAYADAGRVVARSLAEAGVSVDRATATQVAQGVTDALESMSTDTEDESETDESASTDADDATEDSIEEESNEQNDADEASEESGADESADGDAEETHQDDAVEELLDGVRTVVSEELAAHREALLEALAGDDEDGEEDEDEEEEESASAEEVIEELRAKVERLESETRESAGRKGIVTTDADAEDGEAADESTAETASRTDTPTNAFEEAMTAFEEAE